MQCCFILRQLILLWLDSTRFSVQPRFNCEMVTKYTCSAKFFSNRFRKFMQNHCPHGPEHISELIVIHAQKQAPLNVHADISSRPIGLNFSMRLHLLPYIVYAWLTWHLLLADAISTKSMYILSWTQYTGYWFGDICSLPLSIILTGRSLRPCHTITF